MANNLHISYDLMKPGQDYEALIAKIKTLGSWAKVGLSFWYVNSTYTAAQARDILKPFLDDGDKLYVVDATNGAAAWVGLPEKVSTYIKSNWLK